MAGVCEVVLRRAKQTERSVPCANEPDRSFPLSSSGGEGWGEEAVLLPRPLWFIGSEDKPSLEALVRTCHPFTPRRRVADLASAYAAFRMSAGASAAKGNSCSGRADFGASESSVPSARLEQEAHIFGFRE